jgi:catechol 2,3-dioxygenase-like lactoylglutathione lyase family enzyme
MGQWYARPVLFVSDIQSSVDFYVGSLGFSEAWRHEHEGKALVAQVERSGCELILSCQWPDKLGSALIFISLQPDELRLARMEFGDQHVSMKEGWWGYPVIIVEDPDGNKLYFPFGEGNVSDGN